MRVNRRSALVACSTALLAACSSSGTSGLTLEQVQAQAASIAAALDEANQILQQSQSLSQSLKQEAALAMQVIDSLAGAVQSLVPSSSNVESVLLNFVRAVQKALPMFEEIFKINPATEAAIAVGLGLISAFVAKIPAGSASPVPVPKPSAPKNSP